MKRAGRGIDPGRVAGVLERHEEGLFQYGKRITGNSEGGRDAVQETYLQLCGVDPATLSTHEREWLFAVCHNQSVKIRRSERRMIPMSQTLKRTQTWVQTRPSGEPRPPVALEAQELIGQVDRALGKLPQNQREALRLRYEDGLSYPRIAQAMRRTVGSVRYLLHTAINTLREHLGVQSDSGTCVEGGRS